MALARHQDRIVCIKSSFIWDRQESCADTCLKKIAHFFLIYNGFLMSGRRFPKKRSKGRPSSACYDLLWLIRRSRGDPRNPCRLLAFSHIRTAFPQSCVTAPQCVHSAYPTCTWADGHDARDGALRIQSSCHGAGTSPDRDSDPPLSRTCFRNSCLIFHASCFCPRRSRSFCRMASSFPSIFHHRFLLYSFTLLLG